MAGEIAPVNRRRAALTALLVVIGLGSIAWYSVIAGVVNAQSPTRPFDGWVSVLESSDEHGPEQLRLQAVALEPGAPGDRPLVRFSILACGDRPFRGVLVLGGHARLDQATVESSPDPPSPAFNELENATFTQFGTTTDLGPVQIAAVDIDPKTKCISEPGDRDFVGTGYVVDGRLRAPIHQQATVLGIHTPRHSQNWPRVGGLPGIDNGNLGVFEGEGALAGHWMIPPVLRTKVAAGTLQARAVVDVAVPPLTDASVIKWDGSGPIAASVRVTDVNEMASWQNWLAGAGILFGVGGALLTSLLFEMYKSRAPVMPAPSPMPSAPPHTDAGAGRWMSMPPPRSIGLAFLMGFLVCAATLRRRRARDRQY